MRVGCRQCGAVIDLPPLADPHATTWCGCCTRPHHHGRNAAACPGNNGTGHPGEPCPEMTPSRCTVITPAGEDCPGGHCGAGVTGCTVCRPVIHFPVAGSPF
jgi:hypothetical protein